MGAKMVIKYFNKILKIILTLILVSCGAAPLDETDEDEESSRTITSTSDTDTDSDSSSSESSDSEDSVEDIADIVSTNSLALSYPDSLSLTILPESVESSTSLKLVEGETRTLREKKRQADKLLNGTADSCLPSIFSRPVDKTRVTCYEFDQEMIYGTNPSGSTYGTRDGKAENGEACLVTFARNKAKRVENLVDRALGYIQGMLCQAKKEGLDSEMPDVGEELDLKEVLTTAMGRKVSKVSSAKIKRLADQDSRPIYEIDIIVNKNSEVRETHLLHSPASDSDNSTYYGVLWSKVTGYEDPFGGDAADNQPKDPHLSVQYAKTLNSDGTYSVQAEFLRGNIHSDLSDKAFVNGVLDLNVGADFEVAQTDNNYGSYKKDSQSYYSHNEAVTGMVYIAFNLNPDDSTGNISFWRNPGSNYSENARGMVFSIEKDESSEKLKGCAVSGATTGTGLTNALSIRKAKKEGVSLNPNGFLHPFAHTETNHKVNCTHEQGSDAIGDFYKLPKDSCYSNDVTWYPPLASDLDAALISTWTTKQSGSIITRQCVSQNDTTGLYEIDTTLTPAAAGFELLDTENSASMSSKKISPPTLSGLKAIIVE